MFLGPHHIAAGGVSGIGIIAEYTLGWNKAYVIFGLNIIMLILAYLFLGRAVFSKMLFGSFVFPITIALVPEIMLTSDRLLSVLFGSGIFALGISILYRNNASSGGTTIPPLILQNIFISILQLVYYLPIQLSSQSVCFHLVLKLFYSPFYP